LADLLEKYHQTKTKARPHVMTAYRASRAPFAPLCEQLAK